MGIHQWGRCTTSGSARGSGRGWALQEATTTYVSDGASAGPGRARSARGCEVCHFVQSVPSPPQIPRQKSAAMLSQSRFVASLHIAPTFRDLLTTQIQRLKLSSRSFTTGVNFGISHFWSRGTPSPQILSHKWLQISSPIQEKTATRLPSTFSRPECAAIYARIKVLSPSTRD